MGEWGVNPISSLWEMALRGSGRLTLLLSLGNDFVGGSDVNHISGLWEMTMHEGGRLTLFLVSKEMAVWVGGILALFLVFG